MLLLANTLDSSRMQHDHVLCGVCLSHQVRKSPLTTLLLPVAPRIFDQLCFMYTMYCEALAVPCGLIA